MASPSEMSTEEGPVRTTGPYLRWRACAAEFDSFYSARFVALGLGSTVRVLGPEDLRAAVDAEVAAMAGRRM